MEGICYIVGAGENFGLDFVLNPEDLVIAADGGLQALRQAKIRPHVVIGDFDSLGKIPEGDEVITLPTVKDVTDTWAAVELGKSRGYRRFFLYGCTGGRFEHTLANLQTIAHVTEQNMECRMFGKTQVITGLSGGTCTFDEHHQGYLSVFSHSDRCTGVTMKGLKYQLEDAELTNRFPLGVSNEFLGIESTVTVRQGVAILVYDRKNSR